MARPRNTEAQKKEHARIRSARYYAAHPERAKAASKKWRDKDRKRVNAVATKYAKKHRAQYRMHCAARRTRKTLAGGCFTPAEWNTLCKHYKHRCLCCGKRRKLTADHVIPISKGGTSNIDNIQPLCGPCNSSKGTKSTDYRRTQHEHSSKD
jgi:5-methylcytosine-specific restriction endonuclease McrA